MHAAYLDVRNRGEKPENILINWYINPVGTGGYKRACCIPLQNTTGWSGIFGTVVMLQLNRYKWVQSADDKCWYIDQTACEAAPEGTIPPLFRGGAETRSRSN